VSDANRDLGHASCAVLQGSPSPIEYRWAVLNTAGTWPEILRRYVLSRSIASMPHRLVSARVSSAASVLATQTAHVLTPDQHLVLLRSALGLLPAIKCQQHSLLLPESYTYSHGVRTALSVAVVLYFHMTRLSMQSIA